MFKKKALMSELYENQLEKQHQIIDPVKNRKKSFSVVNQKKQEVGLLPLYIPRKYRNNSEFNVNYSLVDTQQGAEQSNLKAKQQQQQIKKLDHHIIRDKQKNLTKLETDQQKSPYKNNNHQNNSSQYINHPFITNNQNHSQNLSTQNDLSFTEQQRDLFQNNLPFFKNNQQKNQSEDQVSLINLTQQSYTMFQDQSPSVQNKRHSKVNQDKFQYILTQQDMENDQSVLNLSKNIDLSPIQKRNMSSINHKKRNTEHNQNIKSNLLNLSDNNISQMINNNTNNNSSNNNNNKLDNQTSQKDLKRRGAAGGNQIFQIHLDRNDQNFKKHFLNICQNSQSADGQPVITSQNLVYFLQLRYGQKTAEKIITFMEVEPELEFRKYRQLIENFNNWQQNDILFFCFYIMDQDNDGIISSNDIFSWISQSNIEMMEKDFIFLSRQLDEFISEKSFKIEEFSKPNYWDFYIGDEPQTHKKFVKKSRFIEAKLNQFIKKNSLYHLSMQRIEHDQLTRERRENYEIDQEQEEKKIDKNTNNNTPKLQKKIEINKKQEIKEKLNQYYSQNKRILQINFELFKELFNKFKPQIFYDLIAYLTLYEFRQIFYPYQSKQFLNIFKEIQDQQQYKTTFYREKEALSQYFPYSYKEKSQGVIDMVKIVQKYKQSGQQSILYAWKKEQEKFTQKLEEKNILNNLYSKSKSPSKIKTLSKTPIVE